MESFSIGRAFSRTGSLISASLGSVGLFVVIVQLVSGVINYGLRSQMAGMMAASQASRDPAVKLAMFGSGWYWALMATSLVLGSIVFSGAISGMIKVGNGESTSVGDCFAMGVKKFLPVLGLLVLWILGIYAGFILLLVPGCILVAMWSVAMPALLAEDTGVIGAFGRSRALTKGSRWQIFLLLLIVVLLLYGALGVMMALIGVPLSGFAVAVYSNLPLQAGMVVFGAAFALVLDALLVAIYQELVELKGGKLSDVFA